MRSLCLILLHGLIGLVFFSSLMAQDQPAPPEDVRERYLNTIVAQDLKAHIYFLADDLLEGRETGQRGQHLAALYVRSQFMRMGLAPGNPETDSYFQPYYLNRASIDEGSMTLDNQAFAYRKDFLNATAGLLPDGQPELALVGYGISQPDYDNLGEMDLDGMVALMLAGAPTGMDDATRLVDQIKTWKERAEALADRGAAGVLMVMPDSIFNVLKRFTRRSATSTDSSDTPPMPIIYVSEKMGQALLTAGKSDLSELRNALNQSADLPKVKLKKATLTVATKQTFSSQSAANVLGYLRGTDQAEELLVITGHYDHIGVNGEGVVYNGADDDASGTSTVMAVAEAFMRAARDGYRPRRSILFMTVSGEEKGLLGSEYYTDHPLYPLANTVCDLNIDMVGRVDPTYAEREDSLQYVYLIGSDRLSTSLHELSEAMNEQYTDLTLDYTYNEESDPNRFYYRSDHYNFAKNNIPVIFYFNGTHEDYHQPGDDPVKIRFDKAARIAQLVFATAWEVANRPERLVVDVK
jgi:hypothetical protein